MNNVEDLNFHYFLTCLNNNDLCYNYYSQWLVLTMTSTCTSTYLIHILLTESIFKTYIQFPNFSKHLAATFRRIPLNSEHGNKILAENFRITVNAVKVSKIRLCEQNDNFSIMYHIHYSDQSLVVFQSWKAWDSLPTRVSMTSLSPTTQHHHVIRCGILQHQRRRTSVDIP